MNNATQTAERLKQLFLKGQGTITQMPGPAAPSTRRFYSYHPGYDFGVKAGTPIYAPAAGTVQDLGIQGGYGRRIAYYDPATKQSYFLSHLSNVGMLGKVAPGTVIGYTGGLPGSYGAGNTTGAHLDIEVGQGKTFADALRNIRSFSAAPSQGRPKLNLAGLASLARQAYGGRAKAVGSVKKLTELQKQYGGRVVRVNV